MKVDLPDPFSPSSACTSPGSIVRSTEFSATTPAKVLVSPVASSAGRVAPPGAGASRHPTCQSFLSWSA